LSQVINQIAGNPGRYPSWKMLHQRTENDLEAQFDYIPSFHPIRAEVEMPVRSLFFTFLAA
jgi:hypothetical protein